MLATRGEEVLRGLFHGHQFDIEQVHRLVFGQHVATGFELLGVGVATARDLRAVDLDAGCLVGTEIERHRHGFQERELHAGGRLYLQALAVDNTVDSDRTFRIGAIAAHREEDR